MNGIGDSVPIRVELMTPQQAKKVSTEVEIETLKQYFAEGDFTEEGPQTDGVTVADQKTGIAPEGWRRRKREDALSDFGAGVSQGTLTPYLQDTQLADDIVAAGAVCTAEDMIERVPRVHAAFCTAYRIRDMSDVYDQIEASPGNDMICKVIHALFPNAAAIGSVGGDQSMHQEYALSLAASCIFLIIKVALKFRVEQLRLLEPEPMSVTDSSAPVSQAAAGGTEEVASSSVVLSLIHISEPTRPY